jgi:hypothetical protein
MNRVVQQNIFGFLIKCILHVCVDLLLNYDVLVVGFDDLYACLYVLIFDLYGLVVEFTERWAI